jgi:hypothetical protein
MEVVVHHEEFFTKEEFVDGVRQNSWCEATRGMGAVLLVNVTGSASTETITHRINVRHCCPAHPAPPPVEPGDVVPGSKNHQSNHLQRSDFANFGSSEVHDLCGLPKRNM